MVAVIGGSGTGQVSAAREMIGCYGRAPARSTLSRGRRVRQTTPEIEAVRRRFGVLFQNGALFSALTVGENIAVPLREHHDIPDDVIATSVGFNLSLALAGARAGT